MEISNKQLKRISLFHQARPFYDLPQATVSVVWEEQDENAPTTKRTIEESKDYNSLQEAINYVQVLKDRWGVK